MRTADGPANLVANSSVLKISNSSVNTSLGLPTAGEYSATNVFLHANGSWATVPGTPPGGSDTHVQYNSGVLVIAPYATTSKGIKIDVGGNVAIGQASATSKLTVNGNIQAVGNVGGAYVTGNGNALTSTKWLGASFTVSTSAPSGGNDGDFWFERVA